MDYVGEDSGADNYKLGAGNDIFWMNENDDEATDVIDGGTGRDVLAMQSLLIAGGINLDLTKASLQLSYGGPADDTILGFEVFLGTDDSDVLKGTVGTQEFYAGKGDDDLTGGAGKDILEGGLGADTFIYTALTDSGPARANRDVILDFTQGEDFIHLTGVDANSTVALDQNFNWIGGHVPFTAAGQLRYRFDGLNTIVEGDANGDGKADFSIAVKGMIAFTGADFIL